MQIRNNGKGENNIAQKISADANLLVVAPSEVLKVITTDADKPYEYSFEDGTYAGDTFVKGKQIKREYSQKGYWKVYYKGVHIDSFNGTSKPIFNNPEKTIEKYEEKYQKYIQNQGNSK